MYDSVATNAHTSKAAWRGTCEEEGSAFAQNFYDLNSVYKAELFCNDSSQISYSNTEDK